MNIRVNIYLVSIFLMVGVVLAASTGDVVLNPNDCDSGIAKLISSVNDTYNLVCVASTTFGQEVNSLDNLYNATVVTFIKPISQSAIEMQMELAESATIWTQADEIYWDYKFNGFAEESVIGIKGYIGYAWDYIWALFILILEVIKLVFYIVETLIVIYILFTLIPESFFKLRDALVRSYIRRYAT